MFWGLTIEPGKHYTQTVEESFHVSMVALDTRDVAATEREQAKMTQLMVHHDKAEFLVCTLCYGNVLQQALDLNFTEGEEVTFFSEGRGTLHLTGYLVKDEPLGFDPDGLTGDMLTGLEELRNYSDDNEEEDEEEDDEEDEEEEGAASWQLLAKASLQEEDDSEDDDWTPEGGKSKRKKKQHEEKSPKRQHLMVLEAGPRKAKKLALMEIQKSDGDSSEEDEEDADFVPGMGLDDSDGGSDSDDMSDDNSEEDMLGFLDDGESSEEEEEEEEEMEAEEPLPGRSKKVGGDRMKATDLQKVEDSGQEKTEQKKKRRKKKKAKGDDKENINGTLSDPKEQSKKQGKEAGTQKPADKTPGKKAGEKKAPKAETPASAKTPKAKTPGGDKSEAKTPKTKPEALTSQTPKSQKKEQTKQVAKTPKKVKLSGGTVFEDLVTGDGKIAKAGKMAHVFYRGTLSSGKEFDSCLGGKPFNFRLGKSEVIRGWDAGIVGMKVGGKRRLTVPASQGYGNQRMGAIPANSTLIFNVELKNVS